MAATGAVLSTAMPYVTAAVGIGGAAASYYQADKAADAQKAAGQKAQEIAAANAKRIAEETAESSRRLKAQQDANLSDARARMAASGVRSGTGSQGKFQTNMESAMASERAWLKKSGASQADIAMREGYYANAQAKAGAASTLASGIGSSAGLALQGAQSSAQWWDIGSTKTPTSKPKVGPPTKLGMFGP